MPYENLRTGSRVKAAGKEGNIREVGDKYKVKFDDGSFGFFDGNEVTPIVNDSRMKALDRMKAESEIKPNHTLMTPTAAGEDPLAQPKKDTDRGIGEPQTVLGKSISEDRFVTKYSKEE